MLPPPKIKTNQAKFSYTKRTSLIKSMNTLQALKNQRRIFSINKALKTRSKSMNRRCIDLWRFKSLIPWSKCKVNPDRIGIFSSSLSPFIKLLSSHCKFASIQILSSLLISLHTTSVWTWYSWQISLFASEQLTFIQSREKKLLIAVWLPTDIFTVKTSSSICSQLYH